MTLTQIGVGPDKGFSITNNEAKWSDFLQEEKKLEGVKTYIYLKVKIYSSMNQILLEKVPQ